jgi:CHAD domain-containing protein
MKLKKSNGLTLPRRFRQLLLQLVHQARNDLKGIPRHPKRCIHALRTRMKKLPAILRLVEPQLPDRSRRAILDSAKRLRQAFAAQRDADVAAEMGFTRRPAVKHRAAVPLFDEVARLTGLIEKEMLDGLTREQVREAYIETYRAGRKRMKACLEDPSPERLHKWRKPVKQLYYQSLAMRSAKGMTHRIRRARQLGRWLGHIHDWQIIIGKTPKAALRLDPKSQKLEKRIFKLARKLYSKRPRKLARQLD